jgi:NADH:ubiquinone oxidoreductase subunit H
MILNRMSYFYLFAGLFFLLMSFLLYNSKHYARMSLVGTSLLLFCFCIILFFFNVRNNTNPKIRANKLLNINWKCELVIGIVLALGLTIYDYTLHSNPVIGILRLIIIVAVYSLIQNSKTIYGWIIQRRH